jgi:hypothetical protein
MIRNLFLLTLFFTLVPISGQNLSDHSFLTEQNFKFRVKQLSEFIDRFNNTIDIKEAEASGNEIIIVSRQTAIANLFNQADSRLDRQSEFYSADYEKSVREFILNVSRDSLHLSKGSENIFASAKTLGAYKNKPVSFEIILNQERVGKDMLKWVISDIQSDFLNIFEIDTVQLRFLPPSSDKLDFMELRRAMNDKKHLDQYADRNYQYSPLSVFFYLVHHDELKIESVQEVKYILYDIPGWQITLSDFNRNEKNSGWLISDLKKITDRK